MGRSCFLAAVFLILALLSFSFSQGFGRDVSFNKGDSSVVLKGNSNSNSKETVETMDYTDPGPNTNPRSGYLLSPPPPVPQG